MRTSGICHSDVGFLDGTLTWMPVKLPLVLEHEVAGAVSEVGAGVEEGTVGDRVAAFGDPQACPGWSVDDIEDGFADGAVMGAGKLQVRTLRYPRARRCLPARRCTRLIRTRTPGTSRSNAACSRSVRMHRN